jgi:zinc protease
VPLDPAVRSAKLPNGLTYCVMRRATPSGRAALWLAVNAGSVLEDDDQRGLAHFVEHMAFHGTAHYPKHALLGFIEGAGMQLGPDVNAWTSFDETVYAFTLPTDRAELLTQGLDVLHEIAHDMSFDPNEVELERSVILEEWRLGRGARARAAGERDPVLFARSRYAERDPIGLPETIRTAPVAVLKRFYDDWYRPDLMGIVAVGDFEPSVMERAIVDRFSDLRNPERPRARPSLVVPLEGPTRASVHIDPDLALPEVTVFDRTPPRKLVTREDERTSLIEHIFAGILRERLGEVAEVPGSVLIRSSVGRSSLGRGAGTFFYSATARPGKLENALYVLLSELVRMGRFGAQPDEFERARKEVRAGHEIVLEEEDRAPLARKASELVRHLFENEQVLGPAGGLAQMNELLPTITLEDVNRLARERARGKGRVVAVDLPKNNDVPPVEATVRMWEGVAEHSQLEPRHASALTGPLITTPPAPGSIVARTHDAGANADVWTLSNGVRVVLKPTEFSNGTVLLRGFQPGGTSLISESEFLNARYAASIVGADGAGPFTSRELATILAGSGVQMNIGIGELEQFVGARGRSEDLTTLFQYLYLRLTSPRADEFANGNWKRRSSDVYPASEANASDNGFAKEIQRATTGDHWRYRVPSPDMLSKVDSAAALALWRRLFGNFRGFTFVLVGRFDAAAVEPFVTTYLATLPSSRGTPHFEDPHVRYPSGIVERAIPGGVEPRARFWLQFRGALTYRRGLETDAEILDDVLENRLRQVLREDLGELYAFGVSVNVVRWPAPHRELTIQFTCAPENLERLRRAVFEELAKIAKDGVDDDVLEFVRRRLTRRDQANRENDVWWLTRLMAAYRYGDDFGTANDISTNVARVTRDHVRSTAQLMFDRRRYVLVTMRPAEPAAK